MGGVCGTYRVLLGKPEGKRPLGGPRHRWNNVILDLQEIVGWIGLILAQDSDRWRSVLSWMRWWNVRLNKMGGISWSVLKTSVSDPYLRDKWVHITSSHSASTRSILISFLSSNWFHPVRLPDQNLYAPFMLPIHATYAAPTSRPVFDKPIPRKAQILKFHTMHFL